MKANISSKAIAEKFIKDQFAIMKKYGSEPRLSAVARRKLLVETTRSFESLRPQAQRHPGVAVKKSSGG